MSVAAVTITRAGPEAAPFAYKLGPQESFALETISAMFDGSGAGGDFLACCSVYSQDGSLLGRYPSPSTVLAGDSAEVTYGPFLRSAGGGGTAAAAPVWARGYNENASGDSSQSVAAGTQTNAKFAHTETTDSAVISWRTVINLNDTADLKAAGLYFLIGTTKMSSIPADSGGSVMAASKYLFRHLFWQSNTNPAVVPHEGRADTMDFAMATGVTSVKMLLENADVNPLLFTGAYLTILYLPTA